MCTQRYFSGGQRVARAAQLSQRQVAPIDGKGERQAVGKNRPSRRLEIRSGSEASICAADAALPSSP